MSARAARASRRNGRKGGRPLSDRKRVFLINSGEIRVWAGEPVDGLTSVLVCAYTAHEAWNLAEQFDAGLVQPDDIIWEGQPILAIQQILGR